MTLVSDASVKPLVSSHDPCMFVTRVIPHKEGVHPSITDDASERYDVLILFWRACWHALARDFFLLCNTRDVSIEKANLV